jgi:hypothetical protein
MIKRKDKRYLGYHEKNARAEVAEKLIQLNKLSDKNIGRELLVDLGIPDGVARKVLAGQRAKGYKLEEIPKDSLEEIKVMVSFIANAKALDKKLDN